MSGVLLNQLLQEKASIFVVNAKYITHCGYSIENNIASDIRLSRNVVNKESKSSRRFVRICNTSSGDNNYCKQGSFILYGRTGGAVHNSIDNWNNNAQCLLVDAHGARPITGPLDSAAGSANAPGLLADAYGTRPINEPLARTVC